MREEPGSADTKLRATLSLLESVQQTFQGYDARLKSLETRFDLHRDWHGPELDQVKIDLKNLNLRLERHAAFLRLLPGKFDSKEAQLRKLFHELSVLKREEKMEEQQMLLEGF